MTADIVDRVHDWRVELETDDRLHILLQDVADEIEWLRDVLRVRGNNIERLKARCVVLEAVIHSVEAWHMVPDEDQKS